MRSRTDEISIPAPVCLAARSITRENADRTRNARSLPLSEEGHCVESSSSKEERQVVALYAIRLEAGEQRFQFQIGHSNEV
jgi:hypothetical protein